MSQIRSLINLLNIGFKLKVYITEIGEDSFQWTNQTEYTFCHAISVFKFKHVNCSHSINHCSQMFSVNLVPYPLYNKPLILMDPTSICSTSHSYLNFVYTKLISCTFTPNY